MNYKAHGMHVSGQRGGWTIYDNSISSWSALSYPYRTKREAIAWLRRMAGK